MTKVILRVLRRSAVAMAAAVFTLSYPRPATSQTFVQLTDLGQNLGPRLTRIGARSRLGRDLFGAIGTKVSFIDNTMVYQLATDPDWRRVLVGQKDEWVHAFDNANGPGGRLGQVLGIDISARKYVYIADRSNGRVFLAEFSPTSQNLVNAGVWTAPQFPRPVDVAWDGGTTPLSQDNLYVLDDSLSSVSYWSRPTLLWAYGTAGTGAGQFSRPSGICVGKNAAANGGTQFNAYIYVVDRGNRRVVWLSRGPSGPTWVNTVALTGWDPADCTVDHFGNVYVVDQANNHIHKFTYALGLLQTYGTFGKGETNYNTLAWPHAISVPCGLKVVNSQTVWYCEGRVVTAEQWSDSSGAVEHYLGMDGAVTGQPQVDNEYGDAWFSYRTTDHGTHRSYVVNISGNYVRTTSYMGVYPPGPRMEYWDGLKDDGTPAPTGTYWFAVLVTSAYGCSGQSWCAKGLSTQTFYHVMGSGCGHPCSPPIAAGDSLSEPSALFLRQRVVGAGQPLARISASAASAPVAVTTSAAGSLSDLVRTYGVRGLSFGVPRSTGAVSVAIRIYSVAGRPIRTLVNEAVDAGYYEVAWDGLDDRGRAAGPGVYFAVLTADGKRVVQRLILRQAP